MRNGFRILAGLTACLEAGCSTLYYPSFDAPDLLKPVTWQTLTKTLPLQAIERQIQCEVSEFISEYVDKYQNFDDNPMRLVLDWEKPATVSVNIQTDFMGKATFLGIDLSKLGLNGVANFITLANKSPSLQANISPKETVVSQIDFVIPQTNGDTYWAINDKAPYYVLDNTGLTERTPTDIKIQKILNNGITISYNEDGYRTTQADGVVPIIYNNDDKIRKATPDGTPLQDNSLKDITTPKPDDSKSILKKRTLHLKLAL